MINSVVFRWSITDEGRDMEPLSKSLSTNKLQKWLNVIEKPRIRELKKLANAYKLNSNPNISSILEIISLL